MTTTIATDTPATGDLLQRLQTMAYDPHKPYPTHFVNPDGPEAARVIAGLVERVRVLEAENASAGRNVYRMQKVSADLAKALTQCRDQFQFYADEHLAAGKTEKAATNQRFADLARAALTLKETDCVG